MGDTYQVVGHYCTAKTMTSNGPMILSFHRGAVLPPDVDEETIEHLLDVKLIAKVPTGTQPGVDAAGVAVADKTGDTGGDGGDGGRAKKTTGRGKAKTDTPATPPAPDDGDDPPEVAELRAKAVAAGMDPAEVAKASPDELNDLLK